MAGGKDDWRCVHLSGARPRAARGETAAVLGVATSVFRPIVPTTAARRTAAARVWLSTSIAGVRAVRFARRHHLDGGAVDAGDEGTTLVTFGRAFNRFALRESFFDALGGIVKHPASRAIFFHNLRAENCTVTLESLAQALICGVRFVHLGDVQRLDFDFFLLRSWSDKFAHKTSLVLVVRHGQLFFAVRRHVLHKAFRARLVVKRSPTPAAVVISTFNDRVLGVLLRRSRSREREKLQTRASRAQRLHDLLSRRVLSQPGHHHPILARFHARRNLHLLHLALRLRDRRHRVRRALPRVVPRERVPAMRPRRPIRHQFEPRRPALRPALPQRRVHVVLARLRRDSLHEHLRLPSRFPRDQRIRRVRFQKHAPALVEVVRLVLVHRLRRRFASRFARARRRRVARARVPTRSRRRFAIERRQSFSRERRAL